MTAYDDKLYLQYVPVVMFKESLNICSRSEQNLSVSEVCVVPRLSKEQQGIDGRKVSAFTGQGGK